MGGVVSGVVDGVKGAVGGIAGALPDPLGVGGALGITGGGRAPAQPGPRPAGLQAARGPYGSGPGLQPGQNQGQLQGFDQSQYGPGEQYYRDNAVVWQSPSSGEQNAQSIIGKYAGGTPQLTNNTQNWFNQFQGSMPNIAADPGLGAYYENAKNRASESIDQAAAARGNYGSSAAIDQNARAFTDLEADRAKNEAQYNLQRLGEQRAWQGLGGQFAGAADSQSLNASQNEQGWQNFLANLGLNSSQFGLQRTNAGMDAATGAQNLNRNRVQDAFGNQLAMGDRMAGIMADAYYPGLDNDAALLQSAVGGNLAGSNAALGQDYRSQDQFWNTLQNGAAAYGNFDSLFGGG